MKITIYREDYSYIFWLINEFLSKLDQ